MIVVQDFQDPYTLDVRKLRRCCVSEIVPDGRLIPFCAYNSVGYREQVRAELAGQARRQQSPLVWFSGSSSSRRHGLRGTWMEQTKLRAGALRSDRGAGRA